MRKLRAKRSKRILVSMTDAEWSMIRDSAAAAHMSVSTYLRNLGLGHEPPSTFDMEAVAALAKVNGDQGRLGGLLKLWLTERPGEGASESDVARMLRQIEAFQQQMAPLALRL